MPIYTKGFWFSTLRYYGSEFRAISILQSPSDDLILIFLWPERVAISVLFLTELYRSLKRAMRAPWQFFYHIFISLIFKL